MGVRRPDPAVSRLARTAADNIHNRRTRYRDQNPERTDLARSLERWPGTDDLPALLAVVDHVRREDAGFPAALRADDTVDLLVILRHLEIEIRRRRYYILQRARGLGVAWLALAKALGVRTAQAAKQTMGRLDKAFGGDRADVPARRPPREYPGLREAVAEMLKHRKELPANLDEELGYYWLETTARATFTDEQLARGLRDWLLGDLVAAEVSLSRDAMEAADRLANILGPS